MVWNKPINHYQTHQEKLQWYGLFAQEYYQLLDKLPMTHSCLKQNLNTWGIDGHSWEASSTKASAHINGSHRKFGDLAWNLVYTKRQVEFLWSAVQNLESASFYSDFTGPTIMRNAHENILNGWCLVHLTKLAPSLKWTPFQKSGSNSCWSEMTTKQDPFY